MPTAPLPAQPIRHITRKMAAGDDYVKSNVCSEFDDTTGKTCKATGDTNDVPISDPDFEVVGTDEVDVFNIWTEDTIYSFQNIGGIHESVDMFFMHMQNIFSKTFLIVFLIVFL